MHAEFFLSIPNRFVQRRRNVPSLSKNTTNKINQGYTVKNMVMAMHGCGSQNGISKGYAATRALGLTKVPNIPLVKQVAN